MIPPSVIQSAKRLAEALAELEAEEAATVAVMEQLDEIEIRDRQKMEKPDTSENPFVHVPDENSELKHRMWRK